MYYNLGTSKHIKILYVYTTVNVLKYVETISRYLKVMNHISLMNEWPNEHHLNENKNMYIIF